LGALHTFARALLSHTHTLIDTDTYKHSKEPYMHTKGIYRHS